KAQECWQTAAIQSSVPGFALAPARLSRRRIAICAVEGAPNVPGETFVILPCVDVVERPQLVADRKLEDLGASAEHLTHPDVPLQREGHGPERLVEDHRRRAPSTPHRDHRRRPRLATASDKLADEGRGHAGPIAK